MRVLIVDDERLARAELRRLLAAHPEVEIVAEASNAAEAHELIAQHRPDLLLLDVQMPGGSGFDLLESLDRAPPTIFTTAFDQYAVKAFEVSALDYLMKPIEPKRLAAALNKAGAGQGVAEKPDAGKIFIKDGQRCWFVALGKIELFESEGNYTRVFFDNEKPLVLRSLSQFEQTLDAERFSRVSRKHIVNLEHVTKMEAAESGGMTLLLSNGLEVAMSRRRAAEMRGTAAEG
ncbi:MAG: response regulator transcription factor [Burkholderiaceae bacterium]|nr:response regulator transcription factor [Burkholderiaceae bacterium]